MLKGTVFDIQRFSVHDGPGIRTTVFMKGCPLRCKWCHNPEGLGGNIQLQYWDEKCIGCGRCLGICECHTIMNGVHNIEFDKCTMCGKCIDICPTEALVQCGKEMTVEEVIAVVLQDKGFYGEDGGVTFSGGEALMQYEFLTQVLKSCKDEGIHTIIDTSGYAKWEHIEQTLAYCDLYLYDIKAFNRDTHKKATGVYNDIILDNLEKLDKMGKKIWIRIPVIEDVNTGDLEYIANFILELKNIEQVTLMPYHVLGKSKYETLGMLNNFNSDQSKANLKNHIHMFKAKGINII